MLNRGLFMLQKELPVWKKRQRRERVEALELKIRLAKISENMSQWRLTGMRNQDLRDVSVIGFILKMFA